MSERLSCVLLYSACLCWLSVGYIASMYLARLTTQRSGHVYWNEIDTLLLIYTTTYLQNRVLFSVRSELMLRG